MTRIGILGLALHHPHFIGGNLGCYALTFSFFEILSKITEKENKEIEVVIITETKIEPFIKQFIRRLLHYKTSQLSNSLLLPYYKKLFPKLSFLEGKYFSLNSVFIFSPIVKRCNCVFDFTAGDSFTDIYGENRFYTRTRIKKEIQNLGIPLILGSQTIGPFRDSNVEKTAIEVIQKCKQVYVRDQISKSYVENICPVCPVLTTDVAFFLPYEKKKFVENRKQAGFNPSGLLWMKGYTGDNEFGLTVDYQEYCRSIIKYLINSGYEVHLILHAFFVNRKDDSNVDNDCIAVDALHKEFPCTIVAPAFPTPMDAKSYISGMNLFIGARMHATIAAISSNTPVIAFSYSRKFEGLFSSLNYPFVVEGTKWNTNEAIKKSEDWIMNISELKKSVMLTEFIVKKKNTFLLDHYNMTINSVTTNK